MSGFGLIVSFVGVFVAIEALWMVGGFRQDFSLMKNEGVSLEQKMQAISRYIESTVEPVYVQITSNLKFTRQVSVKMLAFVYSS